MIRLNLRLSRLLLGVSVSLAVLFAGTAALTRWYHGERARRAEGHIAAGDRFAGTDDAARAVREYRAALALERGDFDAERGLAFALLELGRFSEAEAYLIDLLEREPTSGPLNLGMARVHAAGEEASDARRLYQRAIYGEWPDAPSGGRLAARFELAEYLVSRGSREEVLAELLRLKSELEPMDRAGRLRLARLLRRADAVDVAADVLAEAAEGGEPDVDVLSELADAQAEAGRPADARRTLRRALALEPAREDLRHRLTVVDRVLTLDPTLPNLRITTRTRRARELLRTVVEYTDACESGPAMDLRNAAQLRLRRRAPATPDAAEDDLAGSVELWLAAAECRRGGAEAEAVSRVVDRVRQGLEDPQP